MGSRMQIPNLSENHVYRYDPYNVAACKMAVEAPAAAAPATAAAAHMAPSTAVLHSRLSGNVTFIPYPTETYPIHETTVPREHLVRVFVGQLPYRVTEMQLSWLCDMIAPGAHLYGMETIMKKTGLKGKRLPTGCVHAFAHPGDVDHLIQALSFRVLFDDAGIWFAQDADEMDALHAYCTEMKHNEALRFRDRPYQPVVVQWATSTSAGRHHGASTPPPAGMTTPPLNPHAATFTPPGAAWGYSPAADYSWNDAAAYY